MVLKIRKYVILILFFKNKYIKFYLSFIIMFKDKSKYATTIILIII